MDRAVQVLPPDQVQLVSAPAQRDLGLGVLPLTDEMVAAAEATAADLPAMAVALPPAVNLIPYMAPIGSRARAGPASRSR